MRLILVFIPLQSQPLRGDLGECPSLRTLATSPATEQELVLLLMSIVIMD